MALFTIRIELMGEPEPEVYDDLHDRMEKGGFLRTVTGKKPRDLPSGLYVGSSSKTVLEVRTWVKKQATAAWGKSVVFVAQTETWAWGQS